MFWNSGVRRWGRTTERDRPTVATLVGTKSGDRNTLKANKESFQRGRILDMGRLRIEKLSIGFVIMEILGDSVKSDLAAYYKQKPE